MKKIFSFTAPFAFVLALLGWRLSPESTGAPVSSTGAPDEVNCTTSGCHDDASPNSGTAQSSLVIEGDPENYVPGHSYDITVQISDAEKVRFGYQLVALTSEGKNAGNFSVLEPKRTQITRNDLKLTDRQYATYTYPGTAAVEKGRGEWKIRWTAPAANEGPVNFYLATVSANDDYTDKGDHVYTTSRSLAAPLVSGVSAHEDDANYLRIIAAENNFVELAVKFASPESFSASISDLQGRAIALGTVDFSSNVERKRLATPELARGLYLLSLNGGGRSITQKFIVD